MSQIEVLEQEKRVCVEEATVTLAGEVCLLRDLLLAKECDYSKLVVRLEHLEKL